MFNELFQMILPVLWFGGGLDKYLAGVMVIDAENEFGGGERFDFWSSPFVFTSRCIMVVVVVNGVGVPGSSPGRGYLRFTSR